MTQHTEEITSGPLIIGQRAAGISRGPTPSGSRYATAWSGIYEGVRESEWTPGELLHCFSDGIIGQTPQRRFAAPLRQFHPAETLALRIDGLRAAEDLTELAAAGQAAQEQRFTGTIRLAPQGGRQQILEYRDGFCTDRYDTKAGTQI